ncbi:MAG: acetyl-CoA carboxylase biotin carboxyl carrier protein subunit [Cryobacterium sp.]|nr:acetyl-CoA carboxylase biotin carboxyl carrier protein subunit [Oligoflexia bacterium]
MSKENFRLSGKKIALPNPSTDWNFENRPGGWIIATREGKDGLVERKKFFMCETGQKLGFSLDGFLAFGSVSQESRASAGAGGSDQDLVAQFPGKVRRVLVSENDSVEEGAPLLLLEAMKMEFSVKAPYSGVVTKIRVKEGQQLSPGEQLLEMKK